MAIELIESLKTEELVSPQSLSNNELISSLVEEKNKPYIPDANSGIFKLEGFDSFMRARGFYSNEVWDREVNIQAKIIKYSKDEVICDCLIDRENNIFETRSFSRDLFNHLDKISQNSYILLKIKSKSGSFRIDVFDGSQIVDKKAFDLNDEWNNLEDNDIGQPLTGPIIL